MWEEIHLRFEYNDAVWSNAPLFFHGHVRGFFISQNGVHTWVVQSLGGNILFVEDVNLQHSNKHQPLVRSKA